MMRKTHLPGLLLALTGLLLAAILVAACGGATGEVVEEEESAEAQEPAEGYEEAEAEEPAEESEEAGVEVEEVIDLETATIADQPLAQFFSDTCGGCHGLNREGGTGPALVPSRLPAPPEFYFQTIVEGRPGTIMPPWGSQLSDDEINILVQYILSEPTEGSIEWDMDDIAGSREVLVNEADLPDAPTHDGNVDNLMLITERESESIAVVDGDTHTLLAHVPASYRAHGYTFDPTSDRWAYNLGRDGWLFKIDLYTLQPVAKVRIGVDSRGIAISDDGQYVIAGNYLPHTAVIVDAKTLEPLTVIATEGNDPDGNFVTSRVCIVSDVSPDKVGPYFVIALKDAGQLWRIDYSDPDFPIEKVEDVGHILHDGFLNDANTRFYIASQNDNWMTVVDVENWEIVEKIPTGDTPHPGSGAAWFANGTEYGATVHAGEGKVTVWDLADNSIVAEIPTQGPGLFLRSFHDNPYVWADALFGDPGNEITIFDRSTFEVVEHITDGTMTLHPEFTADGRYVYISDWEENVVRVYDSMSFELVTTIEGIENPTGIFNTSRRLETLGH